MLALDASIAVAAVLVMLLADYVWIAAVMAEKYKAMITGIQKSKLQVNWPYAIIAYLCMAVGLLVFAYPWDRSEKVWSAVVRAALFGAVLYGTYNGTAGAVFTGWQSRTAVYDVAWGAGLYGALAIGVIAIRRLLVPGLVEWS